MLRLTVFAVLSSALLTPAFGAETDAAVAITNQSSWDLHHLFLSSVDEQEWGPDQLGEALIASGESFTLHGIPCDAYDVRLVDEDGDECVVEAVALCADEDAWVIDNSDLLGCQAATEDEE